MSLCTRSESAVYKLSHLHCFYYSLPFTHFHLNELLLSIEFCSSKLNVCCNLDLLVYSPKSSLINSSPPAVQFQPNWQTSIVRETLLVLWWTYAWPLRLADCSQTAKVTTSYRNCYIVWGFLEETDSSNSVAEWLMSFKLDRKSQVT